MIFALIAASALAYDQFLSRDPLHIKPTFVVEGPTNRWLGGSLYFKFMVHRRGASAKSLFIPGAQFERNPSQTAGIPDRAASGLDTRCFCSRDGRTICLQIRADSDDGKKGRLYFWRTGMPNAKPLTNFYTDETRVAPYVARDGRTIWLARLKGHTLTLFKLVSGAMQTRAVSHTEVAPNINRFPPFVFSEGAGSVRILLGTASVRVLPDGRTIPVNGRTPFAEDDAYGLQFYRELGRGGVRVSIEHRGHLVSTLVFPALNAVAAASQVSLYVDDEFIEVRLGGRLRALRQKTFKELALPRNCQIILGNRTLAYFPHSEWGYYLISGSIDRPVFPLITDDDSRRRHGLSQFERASSDAGFSYQAAIGTRFGVIQIYPGVNGTPEAAPNVFTEHFLAPADDRAVSAP